MMNKFRKYILALLLLVVTITPRLPRLNSFVGLDKSAWLTRGGNFYYALGQREFQNTVYEYHPSVLTMWFVTAALLGYFPEYRGLGQGYFDVDKNKFDPFLLEYGKTPIQLLFLTGISGSCNSAFYIDHFLFIIPFDRRKQGIPYRGVCLQFAIFSWSFTPA